MMTEEIVDFKVMLRPLKAINLIHPEDGGHACRPRNDLSSPRSQRGHPPSESARAHRPFVEGGAQRPASRSAHANQPQVPTHRALSEQSTYLPGCGHLVEHDLEPRILIPGTQAGAADRAFRCSPIRRRPRARGPPSKAASGRRSICTWLSLGRGRCPGSVMRGSPTRGHC